MTTTDTAPAPTLEFSRLPHPAPVPGAAREQAIADPGFGKVFTDHMVTIERQRAARCCTTRRKSSRG